MTPELKQAQRRARWSLLWDGLLYVFAGFGFYELANWIIG